MYPPMKFAFSILCRFEINVSVNDCIAILEYAPKVQIALETQNPVKCPERLWVTHIALREHGMQEKKDRMVSGVVHTVVKVQRDKIEHPATENGLQLGMK